ncbi:MAG TPA: hypothetical protein ENI13_02225 [candidate division CPR3 bacterium]|uniref:Uncharacterized protein n=1 Tax=candidate division CPR3 bacterium TaxID=2268181 RepID=A0A7C1SRE0_UNCC3|nr:hypothetical protein [candidate division CPR3 bacterium]
MIEYGACDMSPKTCGYAGAWHFKTWGIKEIETIKFKDLTEDIAWTDGFQHRPWSNHLGCDGCLVLKLCRERGCARRDQPSLWQLRLYLTETYDAKPESLFDIITKKNNGAHL